MRNSIFRQSALTLFATFAAGFCLSVVCVILTHDVMLAKVTGLTGAWATSLLVGMKIFGVS